MYAPVLNKKKTLQYDTPTTGQKRLAHKVHEVHATPTPQWNDSTVVLAFVLFAVAVYCWVC